MHPYFLEERKVETIKQMRFLRNNFELEQKTNVNFINSLTFGGEHAKLFIIVCHITYIELGNWMQYHLLNAELYICIVSIES